MKAVQIHATPDRARQRPSISSLSSQEALLMQTANSFDAKGKLEVAGKSYEIYRLEAVARAGFDVASLPYGLKILLENLLRTEDGADVTADSIKALAGWNPDATPDREIAFTRP
jgi:aconitate hydratase